MDALLTGYLAIGAAGIGSRSASGRLPPAGNQRLQRYAQKRKRVNDRSSSRRGLQVDRVNVADELRRSLLDPVL